MNYVEKNIISEHNGYEECLEKTFCGMKLYCDLIAISNQKWYYDIKLKWR